MRELGEKPTRVVRAATEWAQTVGNVAGADAIPQDEIGAAMEKIAKPQK